MNKLLFRTFLFCLSFLSLCSCRQDDETDRGNESGDLVAVNIPIEGVRVESDDSPLTRGGSAEPFTVTEELEDGFVLETSLMPVSGGLTRASTTTGLANNVQILCIAYKEDRTLYKYQYLTLGSPVIHLPKGERFKLVFYSYNSTTRPDISREITGAVSPGKNGFLFGNTASLNDKSERHTNNVMWGRIDLTPVITSGTRLPGVTFTHLFSRLDWRLQSVVGDITECSGSVRSTYLDGTIKLGNLINMPAGSAGSNVWMGAGSANYAAPVDFGTVSSTDITSRKTVFCPKDGSAITLGLDNITVGGKNFKNKSYAFSTKLKRGVDYRAMSTIKRRMTVTFSAAVGGTVTPEGAQTADTYGSMVTSTAVAGADYVFDAWYRYDGLNYIKITSGSDNEIVVNNKLIVKINGNTEGKKYLAKFRSRIDGRRTVKWLTVYGAWGSYTNGVYGNTNQSVLGDIGWLCHYFYNPKVNTTDFGPYGKCPFASMSVEQKNYGDIKATNLSEIFGQNDIIFITGEKRLWDRATEDAFISYVNQEDKKSVILYECHDQNNNKNMMYILPQLGYKFGTQIYYPEPQWKNEPAGLPTDRFGKVLDASEKTFQSYIWTYYFTEYPSGATPAVSKKLEVIDVWDPSRWMYVTGDDDHFDTWAMLNKMEVSPTTVQTLNTTTYPNKPNLIFFANLMEFVLLNVPEK